VLCRHSGCANKIGYQERASSPMGLRKWNVMVYFITSYKVCWPEYWLCLFNLHVIIIIIIVIIKYTYILYSTRLQRSCK